MEGSEAKSLGDLRAFVGSSAHSSASIFYSSEIRTDKFYGKFRFFNIRLIRRRTRGTEDYGIQEFRIAESDFLKVIATLVACPTWWHALFSFITPSAFVSGFDRMMFETFTLLRSSRSLSSVHIVDPTLCHKGLPTLLCGNPRLETLRVNPCSMDFSLLAKIIAPCLSENSVLKSCTIKFSQTHTCEINRESLQVLFMPFTIGSHSDEANVDVKELVLHFPDSVDPNAYCEDALAALVQFNTSLEMLELRFLNFRSRPAGKSAIFRALEINHTLREFTFISDRRGLEGLIASFDFSGPQPNTSLTTLNLFLTEHRNDRFGKTIKDDLVVILNHVASVLRSNTILKHVRVLYDWGGHQWVTGDDGTWVNRAQVEARTQERLQLMIRQELRSNTRLDSLAVGESKLRRVGTEWQMSFEDQLCLVHDRSSIVKQSCLPCRTQTCTRPVKEYVVEMKIHHSRRLHGIARRLMCFRS